ncbi:MAG: OmpH family outer membrane protein [Bacteroidetes bacterium]|nr:OmpH family outer membrane protein [Bacteroidota bacterium]
MKKLGRVLVIALSIMIISGISTTVSAQKVAHINSNELLRMMPGVDSVQAKVEAYAKELQDTYLALITEFQKKSQEFEANQANFSDLIRQSRQREIESLRERIMEFQNMAEEDLMQHENRLLSPIIDKAKKAIADVAKEKGYLYVLDSGMGTVLFAAPSEDIMPLVKTKLGIK